MTSQDIARRWHRRNFEQSGDTILYRNGLHSGDACEYDQPLTLADLEELMNVEVLVELAKLRGAKWTVLKVDE